MVLQQILDSSFPIMVKASAGSGKCVLGDTLIFTENGTQTIKEIYDKQQFDSIVCYDGSKKVLNKKPSHIHKIEHFDNVIRLKTSLGYEICGTPEHRIYVFNPETVKPEYKKLSEINNDDILLLSRNSNSFGHDSSEHAHNDVIAYILGVCIGDGYFTKYGNIISITKKNDEFRNRFVELCEKSGISVSVKYCDDRDTYVIYLKNVKDLLRLYEIKPALSGDKKIPPKIMSGSKQSVSAFLSGLFDADAGFHGSTIEYSTKSKTMAHQVHALLLNFGIISRLRTKNVKGTDYYVIFITSNNIKIFNDEIGFFLAKNKKNKLTNYIESKKFNTNIDCIKPYAKLNKKDFIGNTRFAKDYISKRRKLTAYSINNLLLINESTENLKAYKELIDSFYFDSVGSISTEYAEYVYDYTIPSYHNFVGNGFVNHNTFSLVEKVKHTIKSGIDPKHIMVSTFTKDAALGLQERIKNSDVQIGTLHSLLWQIVKNYWNTSIYILDDTMKQKMAFTICKENKLNFDKISKYFSEIGYFKNHYVDYYERLETGDIPWSKHDVSAFASEYKVYSEKWHKLDFDDMILFAHRIFVENPQILNAVQEDWKYIFVDEAQDLSPSQSAVISLVKEKYNNIFIVGDIKQNIFGSFRGSSSNYFHEFAKDNPGVHVFTLPKTYRCGKLITANANVVSKVIDNSSIETTKDFDGKVIKPPVFDRFSDEVDFISDEAIKRFHELPNEEIRILFRTNAQALGFQLRFIEAGIPFSSKYENNIFRKKDVRIGLSAIEFAENGLELSWEKAQDIIKDMKHLLAKELDVSSFYKFVWDIKKQRANPMKEPSRFSYYDEIAALNKLYKKLQNMSPSDIFNWIADEGFIKEIGDNENLYGMADFFNDCKNLTDVNAKISKIAKDKHTVDPNERTIILSTIHGSKGLESDTVFVCGIANGLFPIQFEDTDLNEELRLFYVAITRAKQTLYVTGCKTYGKKVFDKNSYLDYIVHS